MSVPLPSYPVFKGLQKPLECFGFKGRYIYWMGGAVGGGLIGFMLFYILLGFLAGVAALGAIGGTLTVLTLVRQKSGLHTKHVRRGVFIVARDRSFL